VKWGMVMEVKLVVRQGKHAGQVVPVQVPKFYIGRSEECQLRPNSDLVSRHHCVILVEEGLVAVRDFNSKNGTFINGQRVRGEQELKAGDVLGVGPLEFDVQLDVGLGGKKKPKVHSVQEAAARTVESGGSQGGADDEIDLNDWLGGEEAAAETQPIDVSASGTLAISDGGTVSEYKPDPVEPPATKPEEKEKKHTPSKPQGMKRPKAADSQSAAADTLRHFLRRR